MIVRVTADQYAESTKFKYATYIGRTDTYSEKHVIVGMDGGTKIEFDPSRTLEEIVAAFKGNCYYRKVWTDECGDIDVCIPHQEVSDSDQLHDPLRYCRKRDPFHMIKDFPDSGGWVGNNDPKPEPPEDMRPHEPTLGPIARYFAKKGRS